MTEEIILKKEYKIKTGKPKNPLYQSEEFLDRVEDFYQIYGRWRIVAKKLNEEFNCNILPATVKQIYKDNIMQNVNKNDQDKLFDNNSIQMKRRMEDAWEMVGDLIDEYRKFKKLIKEKSEGDKLTETLAYMKMSGQIINILGEIRKQLEFISKTQEEIKVYQQNNFNISPVQINQEIKSIFANMSEEQIKSFFAALKDTRFSEYTEQLEVKKK